LAVLGAARLDAARGTRTGDREDGPVAPPADAVPKLVPAASFSIAAGISLKKSQTKPAPEFSASGAGENSQKESFTYLGGPWRPAPARFDSTMTSDIESTVLGPKRPQGNVLAVSR
jgi:hypothetical protein